MKILDWLKSLISKPRQCAVCGRLLEQWETSDRCHAHDDDTSEGGA